MSNLSIVTRIGAGERLAVSATSDIVAALPEGFDPSARGAVAEAVHAWACGEAVRPPVKVGKVGEQRATDYGRGVDALVKSVKRALSADAPKEITLRATLSGEGGGSVTVPTSHPLYGAIVAMIRNGSDSVADAA
jgi:hypothetical protein